MVRQPLQSRIAEIFIETPKTACPRPQGREQLANKMARKTDHGKPSSVSSCRFTESPELLDLEFYFDSLYHLLLLKRLSKPNPDNY